MSPRAAETAPIWDPEQAWLDLELPDALDAPGAASIQYRIAVGQQACRKVLKLKLAALEATSSVRVRPRHPPAVRVTPHLETNSTAASGSLRNHAILSPIRQQAVHAPS